MNVSAEEDGASRRGVGAGRDPDEASQRASLSVVIPAYNEEAILGATLAKVRAACEVAVADGYAAPEVIVVDNASTDATHAIAASSGVRVIIEPVPGIAAARNAGGRKATSDVLFFLDADTEIPPEALSAILTAMQDGRCIGGAPATRYDYRKRTLRPYMAMWALVAKRARMSQGVGQFVTAEAFRALDGYDTRLRMAEDTDFYWRLQDLANERDCDLRFLAEVTIVPSSRRLDEWPIWKTILWTNPLVTRFMLRSPRFWRAWREDTVR